jgi:hypothetical protein
MRETKDRGVSFFRSRLSGPFERKEEEREGTYPSMHCRNLYRVRNNVGGHSFLDRADLRERNGELRGDSTMLAHRTLEFVQTE